ncbi:MAG: hypothetical protein JST84_25255 [Acidobacteria bacterium]|nr:hypothetical protein [Acidobacteriota bacterium]
MTETNNGEDNPEKYRKANLYIQVGLAVGVVVLLLGYAGVMNFDYALYACVICVVIGAAIRQILVSRN